MMGERDLGCRVIVPENMQAAYNRALAAHDLREVRTILLAVSSPEEQDVIRQLLPDELLEPPRLAS